MIDPNILINDKAMAVIEIELNKWWVVPTFQADEDTTEDIGPFPTPEAAYTALLMLKD